MIFLLLQNPNLILGIVMLITIIIAIIIVAIDKEGHHQVGVNIVLGIFALATLILFYMFIDKSKLCINETIQVKLP